MGIYKYFSIAKINLLNALAYMSAALSRAIFIGIIIFVFVHLWRAIYQTKPLVEGFTIAMMIWYLLFAESIVTSETRVTKTIAQDVQSGVIAYHLNKPFHYVWYQYFTFLGDALLKFFTTFAVGSAVAYVMVGGFNFNFNYLIFILIVGFFGLSLNYLMNLSLGLFAFWLEDVEGLAFILHKFVFIIGGMLVPLDVFPSWIQWTKWLPFSYVAYHPAKLFVMFNLKTFINVLAGQLVYIVALFALCFIIFHYGAKKVSIHGG